MHLAFEESNEVKRNGSKSMRWVRYSKIQSNIEIDLEEHARPKAAHSIVSMSLIFCREFDNGGQE